MKKCKNWPISVCTWSLRLPDIQELAKAINQLGIQHIHLALPPALEKNGDAYLRVVEEQGWTVTCTMMAFAEEDYSSKEAIKVTGGILPDSTWRKNQDLVTRAIGLTADMGVDYLSFHFGFIGQPGGPSWNKLLERTRILADEAAKRKVMLLMETGQETGGELKSFLEQLSHSAVGVNFDPANMILYDEGDPIEAIGILGPWIKHVHVKDGRRPRSASDWSGDVPWGTGDVNVPAFFESLEKIGYSGALAIEREVGDQRLADIASAIEKLVSYTG
jgi:sugar phosphate isomerase/epimerase